ncbi:MAG: phosphodiesterase [Planctomycetales bacterium]
MTLRVVQISDLHLFADPDGELKGLKPQAGVTAVLGTIQQRLPVIDQLISTGDHTHDELPATYQRLRGMLQPWLKTFHLLPGNHDERPVIREVFGEFCPAGTERIRFSFEAGGWLFLGLDSHVPGELYGEVGEEQWKWLEAELSRDATKPTAIFLHHPPLPIGSPWMDKIGLRDAEELTEILLRYRQVKFVSHGHIHQEFNGTCEGVPVMSCPSSAIQFRPRTEELEVDTLGPGFRVFELETDGAWRTEVIRV